MTLDSQVTLAPAAEPLMALRGYALIFYILYKAQSSHNDYLQDNP